MKYNAGMLMIVMSLLQGCTDGYQERGMCSYLGGCMESAEEDCADGNCSDAAMTEILLKKRHHDTTDDATH